MRVIQAIILAAILIVLIDLRIAVEKWGVEIALNKVTTVEHITNHNYDVASYGTIRLDGKVTGLAKK